MKLAQHFASLIITTKYVQYSVIRQFNLHVYGKRQTTDSSWEFVKIENEQIKTAQKILMDNKLCETTVDSLLTDTSIRGTPL